VLDREERKSLGKEEKMSGRRGTRGTFVVVKHANQKRTDLSKLTQRTLGAGNLKEAVIKPKGEDINEWLATNAVDFYNEIQLLVDMIHEDQGRFQKPGEGFPASFEYRWNDGKSASPVRCSSPEYIDFVLEWIENTVTDESIFVIAEDTKFPDDFDATIQRIFTRMFRIFAIIYHSHFKYIEEQGAASHLNTSFKHFVFFAYENGLLEDKEIKALEEPVSRLISQFESL